MHRLHQVLDKVYQVLKKLLIIRGAGMLAEIKFWSQPHS